MKRTLLVTNLLLLPSRFNIFLKIQKVSVSLIISCFILIVNLTLLFSCSSNNTSKSNTCQGGYKGRYTGHLPVNDNKVVELSKNQFSKLLNGLMPLMILNSHLDSSNTVRLLRIMNMLIFSKSEYRKGLKNDFFELNGIEILFYMKQIKNIKCQYPFFHGQNGMLDFRTLGVNFNSVFYNNSSMYFVKGISNFSQKTFFKSIAIEFPKSLKIEGLRR